MDQISPNYHQNDITIKQVANGWLLILPPDEYELTEQDIEAAIRKEADIIEEGRIKDPVLRRLQGQSTTVIYPSPNPVSIKDMKQTNIHVFIEFDHLMAFLSGLIKEIPKNQ